MPGTGLSPHHLMEIGHRFWAAKTLLSTVKFGIFTELDRNGPQTVNELDGVVGLHPRASRDFLDTTLGALGVLERNNGQYLNTPKSEAFLVEDTPTSFTGWFEMFNDRLYPFWSLGGQNLITSSTRS